MRTNGDGGDGDGVSGRTNNHMIHTTSTSVCIFRMFLNVNSDVRDEQAGVWAMRSMHATMDDVCNRLLSHIVYTQATLLQHRHD